MKKKILPKLAALPKIEFKTPPTPETCFWCKEIRPMTNDHIIPRWLGGKHTRKVCNECNQERAKISNIARNLKCGNHVNFSKCLDIIAPLLEKYKKLINRKLRGEERLICLEEISIIERDQCMSYLLFGLSKGEPS